jgi:hypothetical protein
MQKVKSFIKSMMLEDSIYPKVKMEYKGACIKFQGAKSKTLYKIHDA